MTPNSEAKVSMSELYRITGRDRVTIAKILKANGVEPEFGAKNSKLYRKSVAVPLILADAIPKTEADAKSRKATADAEKAELIVKRLRGELVSVDAMTSAASELVKTLFQRLVRVEPSIIASKCVGRNTLEIEATVKEHVAAVFNELKSMPENFLSVEDSIEEATGEPDGD